MRRQLRPSIDGLENKTLLSSLAAGLVAQQPVVAAEVQPAKTSPAMSVSLTTNQSTYSPGQVVQMSLTITNNSNQIETVPIGPSMDGFVITQNGNVIWQSNEGVEPQYVVNDVLQPGQSLTLTANWTVPASDTGSFVVQNQLFPSGPTAAFSVTSTPAPPTPTVLSANSALASVATPNSTTPILPIAPAPTPPIPISPVSPTPISPISPAPTPPAPILPILPAPSSPSPPSPIAAP